MDESRLWKQIDFIMEADKIKNIARQSKLFDGSRFENDAEHSWTVCLMAHLFREYADADVDVGRVILMLLVHDLVELYAGDTFLYSADRDAAFEREERAARRIFGILSPDQADELYELWAEFEARESEDAKFAAVFDRFEPLLQNWKNKGFGWKKHGVTKAMVLEKNRHVAEGSKEIWAFLERLLDECEAKGYFPG